MLGSLSEKHHMKMFTHARQFIETNAYHLIPLAWSAAWLLTGLGIWLSDIYSFPSRSIIAYIMFSAAGWGTAGLITVIASRSKASAAVQLAAWAIAYLVAIGLGLVWLRSWNIHFLGIPVAIGAAGTILGIATSLRPGLWRLVSGTLLGVLFFIFSTASFFATYILLLLYTSIAQRYGNVPILYSLSWIIPGAVFGSGAGFATRWILDLKPNLVPPTCG